VSLKGTRVENTPATPAPLVPVETVETEAGNAELRRGKFLLPEAVAPGTQSD